MENIVAKLLQDFEQGKMSRRQLIQSLAVTATAASTVSMAPAAPADGARLIKAININHNSFQVADYARTRDFYADLFGMAVSADDGKRQCRLTVGSNIIVVRSTPSGTPKIDHVAYTLDHFEEQKEAIRAEIKRRKIQTVPGHTDKSIHILDPDGFAVQMGGFDE